MASPNHKSTYYKIYIIIIVTWSLQTSGSAEPNINHILFNLCQTKIIYNKALGKHLGDEWSHVLVLKLYSSKIIFHSDQRFTGSSQKGHEGPLHVHDSYLK